MVVARQPEQVARLSIKNLRGRDMSALFLKQSHSKMIGCGKRVKKNLIIMFLSVFVTLLLLQACSDHKENRMRAHPKNRPNSAEEEIATWKKLIGKTYRVEGPQFVDLRFLPNSGDRVELGQGEEFTVKDLLVDEADHRNSHYAIGLNHGGRVYTRVYELRKLIETRRVVEADRPARTSATGTKDQFGSTHKGDSSRSADRALRSAVIRPAIFAAGHGFMRTHRPGQLSDLLTEEWGFRNVLILMIVAVGTGGIVCVLWQIIGIKKTFCFLAVFCLGYWQLSSNVASDTVWGSLLILLALTILLVSLLGVWNFVRFVILLATSLVMLHIVRSFYREIGSPILVALVSILAVGVTANLFFLLLKIRVPVKDKPHDIGKGRLTD